ncbi:MAG: hypothetical protein IPG17_32370 [Sandaracinaceae bacterium]|nr:hypothetical protein [Sandaracinaceae bacterium]
MTRCPLRALRVLALCCLLPAVIGCGDANTPPGEDAGLPPDERCETPLDCDDGLFCNGAERCTPTSPDADERGCVSAAAPCLTGQACLEAQLACETVCSETEDADDDGHRAMVCGGDDCDDSDRVRFPGNTEVCDVEDRDEDCDPTTFGFRDQDGDGVADATCCNDGPGGAQTCGRDCDDAAPGISPTGTEACDGLDNDCDGMLDEGVQATFYRDADGDGFGDPTLPVEHACTEEHGDSLNGFDCDDADDTVRPGASELCDGADNNCDGLFERDLDRDGHLDPGSVCSGGNAPVDDCNDFSATTYADATELCDRVDNDCDGSSDERVDADASCAVSGVAAGFCIDGACHVAACEPGFGDCNADARDGCETDLATSATHCGTCQRTCPLAETCTAGLCALPNAVDLAVGERHACVVTSRGAVGCWGENSDGQLGAGTSELRRYASHSSRFGASTAVATSTGTTCAIAVDGRVFCDGHNRYSERGVGNAASFALPTVVSDLTDVRAITGTGRHFCAERDDGVWCWGWGPGLLQETTPALLASGGGEIGLGGSTLCGFGGPVDGLWCLGSDEFGQLGDDTVLPLCPWVEPTFPVASEVFCSSSPLAVDTDLAHDLVAVGDGFTCSADGGSVACWGDNSHGQGLVPPPTSVDRPLVVAAQSPDSAALTALRAGRDHACVRRADGTVACWGGNDFGQLGRGTTDSASEIEDVPAAPSFVTVEAGGDTTCAIDTAGQAWCWGLNDVGQVGDRSAESRSAPTRVTGFDTARGIARGGTCAVMRSGEQRCWGGGDPMASVVAETDEIHTAVVAVSHTCVLRAGGEVWCWGLNDFGQLGNGTIENGLFAAAQVDLEEAVSLSANSYTTCAVLATGGVRCWGQNLTGQLGLDTSITAAGVLVAIPGVDDALSVSVGQSHVCAVRRSGAVACWGSGGEGQLGDGLGIDSVTPVAVVSLDDVVQVEAGNRVTCARRVAGSVYCWGTGTSGQLGAGANRPFSPTPIPVRDVRNATALHLTGETACIIDDLAEVYCWGFNGSGQAGPHPSISSQLFVAQRVPGVLATQIAGSRHTTCAVGLDDAVRCWGESTVGEAGVLSTDCFFVCDPGGCSGGCPAGVTTVGGL